ncbi:hypothetical protein NPIL_695441 [Nephila pilipes]|uniref:Uncharacterized protein n=1 Tax=Nephila pilipes TaxID=299642 RepID=A0A8X6PIB4_NEPPI|nr:hypothetical protein NPIL_695441 [Nephila pilipes]
MLSFEYETDSPGSHIGYNVGIQQFSIKHPRVQNCCSIGFAKLYSPVTCSTKKFGCKTDQCALSGALNDDNGHRSDIMSTFQTNPISAHIMIDEFSYRYTDPAPIMMAWCIIWYISRSFRLGPWKV